MAYYNKKIIFTAAKLSFINLLWLMVVIGIPMLVFADGLNYVERILLFVLFTLTFWSLLFGFSLFFHRLSLRHPKNRQLYLALGDVDKAESIINHLKAF